MQGTCLETNEQVWLPKSKITRAADKDAFARALANHELNIDEGLEPEEAFLEVDGEGDAVMHDGRDVLSEESVLGGSSGEELGQQVGLS